MLFYTHFQVNSDTRDINGNMKAILNWLAPFTDLSVSEKGWRECQIAIVEGFTNAVYHAHQHLPIDTPVHIELTGYSHCLEICIWDFGPPFDFLAYLAALPAQLDPDKDNGRGLRIIVKVADELKFYSWDFSDRSSRPAVLNILPTGTVPATNEYGWRIIDQGTDELKVDPMGKYTKCLIFVKYRMNLGDGE